MAATATKPKAPRKIVSVDVDAKGMVTRTLTEPAKKTLENALATLGAMSPVMNDPAFETMRWDLHRVAHAWGCAVPDPADLEEDDEEAAPPDDQAAGKERKAG